MILGLFVGLSIAELGVRVFQLAPKLPDNVFFTNDPYLPYKLKPLHHAVGTAVSGEFKFDYTTNSYGFVDIEHTLEKPANTFRILVLGDSFTRGVGATPQESYPSVLQKLLNKRSGHHPKIECINAGQPGYWTEPEYLMAKAYGLKFHPDLILVGFLPNDVIDTSVGIKESIAKGDKYLFSPEARKMGDAGIYIYKHFHVGRILLGFYINKLRSKERPILWSEVYRQGGTYEAEWVQIESNLKKINTLAKSIGAQIAIIHIPQRPPWPENREYPAIRLGDLCQEISCHAIDTLPDLKKTPNPLGLYWENDGHCNKDGYAIIARTVSKYLQQHSLVP